MKAVVFTLGCKVNSYESDILISGLKSKGYEVTDKLEKADLYILNTCAVTLEAEKKSRQLIARAKKFNEKAKIIVTGCATQNNPNAFINKENVVLVTGAKSKEKILELLEEKGTIIEQKDEYNPCEIIPQWTKSRAYVKIQDGCNNFCSYCLIPYLRGRSRSRNPQEIIKEIEKCSCQEIVLTGINLSAYSYQDITLSKLIGLLGGIEKRFRLGSLEIGVIDDEFLTNLKKLKHFSPHFHLSLQSGSDSVLKSMNRHYTTDEYYKKVELIRKYFPLCAITTDVIVGYSTETEQCFEQSMEFCDKVHFADIHCFPYSKRAGTMGAKLKELSPEIKKERMNKILELKQRLIDDYYSQCLGKELTFIPEEYINGYTEGITENYIKTKVLGKIEKNCKVVLLKKGQTCVAKIIE